MNKLDNLRPQKVATKWRRLCNFWMRFKGGTQSNTELKHRVERSLVVQVKASVEGKAGIQGHGTKGSFTPFPQV